MKDTGRVTQRNAISILRDIARALQYAHGEGVIHRDIKPENVLLAGDAAVVTDFGIAKAISVARTSPADVPEIPTLTQAGSSIGTPAYMAPEQVAGDPIDYRADLYAWGLVAYELLSGAHPFADKTNLAQLLAAQLSQLPAPLGEKVPGIAPAVADLVMRCLAKSADDRPVSATELLDGLDTANESRERVPINPPKRQRSLTVPIIAAASIAIAIAAYALFGNRPESATPVARRSVAVLPFADDRADSTEAYFGEGIADELMTALGKVPGLRVASRTSAIALGRRHDLDVREIGRQLGVATVVEGTVRRSGNQLRVTAQLTNASDGLTLWSDAYERENKDVFAVQDEITQAIVTALRPELGERSTRKSLSSRATGPGTSDPEAYDLYLRGLYLLERRGIGVTRAAEYFSKAIEKDSMFARAYAGLADALEFFPYFAGVPAKRVEARVREAAERSLRLDPTLAEPRVALAMAHWHAYRWKEAGEEFRRAIAADSTAAAAHTQYGRYLLSVAKVREAVQEFRTARRLDPLAATSSVWLSHSLAYMGDYAAAFEEARRSRELDPNLWNNRTVLVFDLVATRRFKEALELTGQDVPPQGFAGFTAYNLHMAGDTARAAAIRRNLDALPDTMWIVHATRVFAYLATGDSAKVFSEMESALDHGEIIGQMVPLLDRVYDPVRHSPRFAAIVKRAGLEGRGFTGPNGGRPSP
jgi:serine/threonine-protein kinase